MAESAPRDARERILEIVRAQPKDASLDDILRELAFHRVIIRGLEDEAGGRTVAHLAFRRKVRQWLDE